MGVHQPPPGQREDGVVRGRGLALDRAIGGLRPAIALLAAWLLASAGEPASTSAAVPPAMASAASLILSDLRIPLRG